VLHCGYEEQLLGAGFRTVSLCRAASGFEADAFCVAAPAAATLRFALSAATTTPAPETSCGLTAVDLDVARTLAVVTLRHTRLRRVRFNFCNPVGELHGAK
jgi:hypothetical protein